MKINETIQYSANVYYNLGLDLQNRGQLNEAISCYQKAIELNPNDFEAYNNLGLAMQCKGELDKAINFYKKALSLNPNLDKTYYNLGIALQEKGQHDESIIFYQKALQINPNYIEAYINLGNALQGKGQFYEALAYYQKALQINPNSIEAHVNKSIAHLLLGNYKEGWKEYNWRWKMKDFIPRKQNFSQPLWDGSDIAGRTILLYVEQGFGDTIQFIRYAALVAKLGAKVIFECHKELLSLLQDVDGIQQIVAIGEKLPEFDVACPLLTLPLLFDTTLENIPAKVPYITVEPFLIRKWKEKVRYNNSKLKVGIAWSGRTENEKLNYKSCSIDIFLPLLQLDDINYYSLQKGGAAEQAKNIPKGIKFVDYTEEFKDFSDTAALIENLDLVISVDTAVAHLAGALGRPVWTLLPFIPDWRWLLNREDSPWYPTMRLFRQPSPEDWESVINNVLNELKKKIKEIDM